MSKAIKMLLPALAFALPIVVQAQTGEGFSGTKGSPDMVYCSMLTDKYAHYVGTHEASTGVGKSPEVEGHVASAKCKEGGTTYGIPILERKLVNAKVELPARPSLPAKVGSSF